MGVPPMSLPAGQAGRRAVPALSLEPHGRDGRATHGQDARATKNEGEAISQNDSMIDRVLLWMVSGLAGP
jgi:hypothetical protein